MAQQLIVLVVIPDDAVRRTIADVLRVATDHLIHECADVVTATAAIRRVAPDLLVIDANLADVRAGEALLFQASAGRPDLPVLRMSEGVPEARRASEFDSEFDPVEFIEWVERLLGTDRDVGEDAGRATHGPVATEVGESEATVLVIDDDGVIRDLLVTLVTGRGRRVITATDGPAGLAAVRTQQPDLVILDQMMPRMAGMDVLEELRAEGNLVPVVMLTAYGTDRLEARGWNAGVSLFLTKPFDATTLEKWVDRLLAPGRR